MKISKNVNNKKRNFKMIKAEQKHFCRGNPFKFSRLNPLNWMLLSQLMLFWSLKFRNRILNSEFNNRLCSGNVDTLAWQMGLANQTKLEFQDSTSNELLYTVFLWNYLVQLYQFLWWEVFLREQEKICIPWKKWIYHVLDYSCYFDMYCFIHSFYLQIGKVEPIKSN